MNRLELKQYAKDKLQGKWQYAALGTLVYILLSGQGITLGNTTMNIWGMHITKNFASLISLLLTGPMSLGYVLYMTYLLSDEADYGKLLKGFGRFADTFVYHFLTSLLTILGFIFFIVPGIMIALNYAMGYLLMRDDPDLTATEAMAASKALMYGHRMDLFTLYLSYIGWAILSLMTFGIGFLFLQPYVMVAKIQFYETIKSE